MKASISLRRYSGCDEVGALGEQPLEPLLVGRQAEEPVLLGDPLERHVGWFGHSAVSPSRTMSRLGTETLRRAVPALVRAHVQVAVGVGAADHLLRGQDVVGVGGANEPVGRDEQLGLGLLEQRRPSRRRTAGGSLPSSAARPGDIERVLVGAGQEARVVADSCGASGR